MNNDQYDLRRVNLSKAAASLDRYNSANFFRYSFVRRFITVNDDVLEIGCGNTLPLYKILTGGPAARVNTYLGVDMCKFNAKNTIRASFKSEFNFVERWKELESPGISNGFDVIVHIEVIEHMKVELGEQMLQGCYELLRPGGKMLLTTPCYDGKKMLFGHIHEYTVPELHALIEKCGFVVENRFGTMMDIRHLNRLSALDHETAKAVATVHSYLKRYFDNDALSCFFAPLFPDYSRDCLWKCTKV